MFVQALSLQWLVLMPYYAKVIREYICGFIKPHQDRDCVVLTQSPVSDVEESNSTGVLNSACINHHFKTTKRLNIFACRY